MKNIFKSLSFLILIAALIMYPQTVMKSASSALDICTKVLLPTLFPFFVLSKLFINCGGSKIAGKIFAPVMRPVFGIESCGATAFLLGVLCGYPVGAKTAVDLYNKGFLSKEESDNLICFCNNSGPLFIIGAVGSGMLCSREIGVFLYIIHILSSLTLGIILRFSLKKKTLPRNPYIPEIKNQSSFTDAVEESAGSFLNVCAYVIFFGIILDLTRATGIFNIFKNEITPLVYSVFEMTTAIKKLSEINTSPSYKLTMISFMLGWSGLSIHFQTKSILKNYPFRFTVYIKTKFFQGIIASLYTLVGMNMVHFDESVFLNINSPSRIPYTFMQYGIITSVIAIAYIITRLRSAHNKQYSVPKRRLATKYKEST